MSAWRHLLMQSIVLTSLRWFVRGFRTRCERRIFVRTAESRPFCLRSSPLLSPQPNKQSSPPTQAAQTRGFLGTTPSESRSQLSFVESKESWLVVGDGDLSYSAQVASTLEADGVKLIATVLESQETHHDVYRNSELNTRSIESHQDHSVVFGIDATRLENHFGTQSFDRIIFNFPHWRGKANSRYNRQLLNDFLLSSSNVIKLDGEIHVALCRGQGGTEAESVQEWRQSWMVAQYAAEHGLLLHRLESFDAVYNRSSHRGIDRPFFVGDDPLKYIFGFPNGSSVAEELQIACRHELRIVLNFDNRTYCTYYTKEELIEGDLIPELARSVAPDGVRVAVPLRDVVVPKQSPFPLLVFLIVYAGEILPLTRSKADDIRAILEKTVIERLGLQVAKPDRMVSRSFPYSLLDRLIEEHTS